MDRGLTQKELRSLCGDTFNVHRGRRTGSHFRNKPWAPSKPYRKTDKANKDRPDPPDSSSDEFPSDMDSATESEDEITEPATPSDKSPTNDPSDKSSDDSDNDSGPGVNVNDSGKNKKPKKSKTPIHYRANDYQHIDGDVTNDKKTQSVPLDFMFKKEIQPGTAGTEYRIKLVPLDSDVTDKRLKKSKNFESKVVNIEKGTITRAKFNADVDACFEEKKPTSTGQTAKALYDEMVTDPTNFRLVPLLKSDVDKVNTVMDKYEIINRSKFEFREIIRKKITKDNPTPFTGNVILDYFYHFSR